MQDLLFAAAPTLVWGLVTRSLGLVFAIAFVSLGSQIVALAGRRGVAPVAELHAAMRRDFPTPLRWLYFPSLLWLSDDDRWLGALPWIGFAAAVSIVVGGPHTPLAFFVCWLVMLSLDRAAVLVYPWDSLLLEAGFWAMALPALTLLPEIAAPAPALTWLYRLALCRVMFGFGKQKFVGSTRSDASFLHGFFIRQPLPTPLGVEGSPPADTGPRGRARDHVRDRDDPALRRLHGGARPRHLHARDHRADDRDPARRELWALQPAHDRPRAVPARPRDAVAARPRRVLRSGAPDAASAPAWAPRAAPRRSPDLLPAQHLGVVHLDDLGVLAPCAAALLDVADRDLSGAAAAALAPPLRRVPTARGTPGAHGARAPALLRWRDLARGRFSGVADPRGLRAGRGRPAPPARGSVDRLRGRGFRGVGALARADGSMGPVWAREDLGGGPVGGRAARKSPRRLAIREAWARGRRGTEREARGGEGAAVHAGADDGGAVARVIPARDSPVVAADAGRLAPRSRSPWASAPRSEPATTRALGDRRHHVALALGAGPAHASSPARRGSARLGARAGR